MYCVFISTQVYFTSANDSSSHHFYSINTLKANLYLPPGHMRAQDGACCRKPTYRRGVEHLTKKNSRRRNMRRNTRQVRSTVTSTPSPLDENRRRRRSPSTFFIVDGPVDVILATSFQVNRPLSRSTSRFSSTGPSTFTSTETSTLLFC